MRRSSPTALLLAGLLGMMAGFALPRFPSSFAADAPKQDEPKKEEAKKDRCNCEQVTCTRSDGLRGMIGPCDVRCGEDKTPTCECGKCGEDGSIEKRSTCRCK